MLNLYLNGALMPPKHVRTITVYAQYHNWSFGMVRVQIWYGSHR